MDILIFIIVSVFGLVLTFLGFRYVEFSFLSLILNMLNFAGVGVDGLTEVIGYNSSGLVSVSYDVNLIILIPILFAVVNFFPIVSYFREG